MPTPPDRLLRRLEWHVVRRLDGQLQGAYRTVHRGAGIDFTGLREYTPEDDVRHIDWNVTARLDEPYIPGAGSWPGSRARSRQPGNGPPGSVPGSAWTSTRYAGTTRGTGT